MFIIIKNSESLKDLFLKPDKFLKVYLKDEVFGEIFYMVKCDHQYGTRGIDAKILYRSPDCPPWNQEGRLRGFTHIAFSKCDEVSPDNNEEAYDIVLQRMEEFI